MLGVDALHLIASFLDRFLMTSSVEDLREQAAAKRQTRLTASMIAIGVLSMLVVCLALLAS